MSVPEFQSYIRPVLEEAARGPASTKQLTELLAAQFNLSAADLAETVPSGNKTRHYDRVTWATTYLFQAGFVERPAKGVVKATPEGFVALTVAPDRITKAWLSANSDNFRKFATSASEENSDEKTSDEDGSQLIAQTPEETIQAAFEQHQKALADDLLQRLIVGSPAFFEHTIRELLVKMGYGSHQHASQVLGSSGDDGVDGVVNLDALGVDQVYYQAKRYQKDKSIGAGALRDFFGALALKDVTKGIFVTTARFSQSAEDTAEKLSKRIVLIDGNELAQLLVRYSVGCKVRSSWSLSEIEESYFE